MVTQSVSVNRLVAIAALAIASCGGSATNGASSPSSNSPQVATTTVAPTIGTSTPPAVIPATTVAVDIAVGLACLDLGRVAFDSHVEMRGGGLKDIGTALGQFYESARALVAVSTSTCPSPLKLEGNFDEYGIIMSGEITVFPGSFMNVDIPHAASQAHVQTALLLAASALTDNAADARALAQEALLARNRPASGPSCGAVGVALRTYSVRDATTDADGTVIKFSAC